MRLLKIQEVCRVLGICKSQVYRLVSEGKLPRPAKIGRASRFSEPEIVAYIEQRLAVR